MVIHEGVECDAKTLVKFFGGVRDPIAEVVCFEAQPKAFDGIKIRTIGREKSDLEVMPSQPGRFVPGSIV